MNFPQSHNRATVSSRRWKSIQSATETMANRNEKNPTNVPGPFYADHTCIDCDMCREIAPRSFRRDDDCGMSAVFHQPTTDEELAQAREAMESCPTNSIGDDGERD
jgi:ferredoxin